MIRCLVFDLGNVVVRFSHVKASLQIAESFGTTILDVQNILFKQGLHKEFETGTISTEELFQRLRRDLSATKPPPDENIALAFNDIFELEDGILDLLRAAKSLGLRIVALSNINPLNAKYIVEKWPEVFSLFDEMTYSYEVGAMKPSRKIYDAAIENAGFSGEECLYTDDISEYVEAGIKCGLNAVIFEGCKKYIHDLNGFGVSV